MQRTFRSRGGLPWWFWRASADRRVRAASPWSDESEALFARFATAPTEARKLLIDTLIVTLKTAGIWAKFDAFYVLAAADVQASRQNWVAGAYNLTAVVAPAFVADRGCTGDGATSYFDTGFVPSTAPSPKYVLNSAHMGVWSRTDLQNGAGSSLDLGNSGSAYVGRAVSVPGRAIGRSNIATLVPTLANGAYPGHAAWSRSAAGVWEGYGQGIDGGGGTNASVAVPTASLKVCAAGTSGASSMSVNQIAAAHFGASLTAAEVLATYNALRAYLQAVGAA
jgi:hypothetical protein